MCLKMFYFDDKIYAFEKNAAFNDCLRYLENLFQKTGASNVLNSLIGFSWYYLIEGPLDSGRYEKEDTSFALSTWKQYIDKVIDSDVYDSFTLYICAYTLSLHGIYLGLRYEKIGLSLMKKAAARCADENLSVLINAFLTLERQKKYKPVTISQEILNSLFDVRSLLGKYFFDIYGK